MKKSNLFILLFLLVACQSGGEGRFTLIAAKPTETAVPRPPIIPAKPTPLPAKTNSQPVTPVDNIQLIPFVTGFKRPVYMTHAGGNTLYVVEQAGKIKIIADGQLRAEPFLDISAQVNDYINEQGLLGLAFHPDFAQNGTFYIYYTTEDEGNSVLARYKTLDSDPFRADPASETILLTFIQPDSVHNAGQLQFGPDGYLYVGVGDGGLLYDKTGNGQNPETLLGSILRLDVDATGNGFAYGIPATNPFVGEEREDEIWAYGWRNPWRFSFDRVTGDLFTTDVGEFEREELNFQPVSSGGGENYGWNVWEGSSCFQAEICPSDGFTFPVFEFDHQEGCAIIGGYMYRGQALPTLWGNYFLGDYCTGKIWRLFPNGDGSWQADVVLDSEFLITGFAEDAAGELYLLTQQGEILTLNN